jgi:hypothetical protein
MDHSNVDSGPKLLLGHYMPVAVSAKGNCLAAFSATVWPKFTPLSAPPLLAGCLRCPLLVTIGLKTDYRKSERRQ